MEKIIVIGTEKEAESFLYKSSGKYEVVLFVDKKPRRNAFRGVSVIALDSIVSMRKDFHYKIIIATKEEEYIEIARKLTKYGFEEFQDFFYSEALDKKLAFFWGNCHIGELAEYMKQFPSFRETYWIYPLTNVHLYDQYYLNRSFFEQVSLFIYQEISSITNGMLYSSEGMCKRIPKQAVRIKMPNLYQTGFAFFPQSFCKGIEMMRDCEHQFVINMDNHDRVITQKVKMSFSPEQVALQIENDAIFEKEKIIQDFEQMLNKIEEMDLRCDVKIAKWIKEHYREEMIFIDPGHMSKNVFVEYVCQIFNVLGADMYEAEKKNIQKIICRKSSFLRMPVYGCVRDALQLNWVDEANRSIKKGSWCLQGECLDILEYVKQYSYICVENFQI